VAPWIQNGANPQRNGHIKKVLELAKLCIRRDMGHNFRVRATFSYRERNRNRDQNRILNPLPLHVLRPLEKRAWELQYWLLEERESMSHIDYSKRVLMMLSLFPWSDKFLDIYDLLLSP